MINFTVPGMPQPQGSKKPGRNRKTGQLIMIEDNDNLKPWRAVAIFAAREATGQFLGWKPMDEAVEVIVWCYFPRPQWHYGTGRNAGVVKDSAPKWPSVKPDGDKLARAIGDALEQAGVVRNDSRIVDWHIHKRYCDTPRIEITVRPMEPGL
jgi:Holliday junction resolvase RusA-like endonuclease